jgi:hypothetical protein
MPKQPIAMAFVEAAKAQMACLRYLIAIRLRSARRALPFPSRSLRNRSRKAGRRQEDGSEILPVIDPSVARWAICIEVIQHLPIHKVTAEQFADSLPNIKSTNELAAALLQRYEKMFPDQSADDLLRRGCALEHISTEPIRLSCALGVDLIQAAGWVGGQQRWQRPCQRTCGAG